MNDGWPALPAMKAAEEATPQSIDQSLKDYMEKRAALVPLAPGIPRRFNAGVQCDVSHGPCACGATHCGSARDLIRAPESDPCPTPVAQAIHMRSEPPPDSTPVQVDQRIDRLLAENLALLTERKQLRSIADERATRANELLAEARKAKKLVRAVIAEKVATDLPPDCCDAWAPLAAWAAETL